jgi:hypothetical protein
MDRLLDCRTSPGARHRVCISRSDGGVADSRSLLISKAIWVTDLFLDRQVRRRPLVKAGTPPKVLQTILGHASITMTLDLYGHLYPDEMDRRAELLGACSGQFVGKQAR